ncbi:monofunctional chorismate mutase, clade 1 [Desulfosporosinus orientis DSM 765]|uniref:chorismate mutase n=1 Tax=Desulfosporosinus orientis (strain ATCC 19365 / DSM 765 / NCIMB 8382 / VKM B-1628 / Singapore I) TaxID=768706 RepID=G7WAM0_DESOD|nr:chorismate mutase [Desulfosporosinus orientis]AET66788.1 monofunctional chorismate mutase, clade 1 [Desulfosporosinus orientis DSM 765]
MVRGIRGATTVDKNDANEIREATQELLQKMLAENSLCTEDLVSAIFTVTADLNADFPASSARGIGWQLVPLLCATEIPVPGSLPHCIRVLLHANTNCSQKEIRHIFLRNAAMLRKDLLEDDSEAVD